MIVSPWTNIVTVILCQSRTKDAVTELYRCVVEIKMKVEMEDGHGESKGAGRRGLSPPCFTPPYSSSKFQENEDCDLVFVLFCDLLLALTFSAPTAWEL